MAQHSSRVTNVATEPTPSCSCCVCLSHRGAAGRQAAASKVFVREGLRGTYLTNNPDMADQTTIEVFGRNYFRGYDKNLGRYGKINCESDNIKKLFRENKELKNLSEKFNIQFIGLDDRDNVLDIHKRYFYTERYLFEIEHAFETRPGKQQEVCFDTTTRRSLFQKTYRENSEFFNKGFNFYAGDIW